jgi:hypothetical protein
MSFSRPIQWYHSHGNPIWLDGTFKTYFTLKDSLVLVLIGGYSSPVEDGAEGEAVPPAGGHVVDGNPWVSLGDPTCPHLQRLRSLHRHP